MLHSSFYMDNLGFTYCGYSSHHILTITILYLVGRKSIRIWEALPALGVNAVAYYFYDVCYWGEV